MAAARALDGLASKSHTRIVKLCDGGVEIGYLDDEAVPATWFGNRTVRKLLARGRSWAAEPQRKAFALDDRERRAPAVGKLEAKRFVKGQRRLNIVNEISDSCDAVLLCDGACFAW